MISRSKRHRYDDPVDGTRAEGQGIRILFENGSRVIFRLSGTGTAGATVRVYLERVEDGSGKIDLPAQEALSPLAAVAWNVAEIGKILGRSAPIVT